MTDWNLFQVEKNVAEEEMFCSQLLPDHRTRHGEFNAVSVYKLSCYNETLIRTVPIINLSHLGFFQPNKPPTRLNLLTCQVKPSVEDKKCFDLISRTTHKQTKKRTGGERDSIYGPHVHPQFPNNQNPEFLCVKYQRCAGLETTITRRFIQPDPKPNRTNRWIPNEPQFFFLQKYNT